MKKKIILFYLLCFNAISMAKPITSSKTFFSARPLFQPTSPEVVSILRDQYLIETVDKRRNFNVIVLGGRSTNDKDLAKYFLPFGKTEILAGEFGSDAVKEGTVDVIANYFGVLTSDLYTVGDPVGDTLDNYTFESKFTIKPHQTFFAAALNFRQHLSRYTDQGFWFDVLVPIEYIRHIVKFEEKIITSGGPNGDDPSVPKGFVGNMRAAFEQPKWLFGKIKRKQEKTSVSDIQVRLGYTYFMEENRHLESYWGIIIPGGNKPRAEYLFEPIAGNNGHFAFYFGASAGFKIWGDCDKELHWELDTAGTIFFSNTQFRSFDLKDKSWSRYIWIYADSKSTNTSPGINQFTKAVHVEAGSARDLNTAFVYKHCGFLLEGGYHFWARQAEEVKLAKNWQRGPAIASIINQDNEFIGGGVSRNVATIKDYLNIDNDSLDGQDIYKELDETDLNLESAAHPTTMSHTFYGTISYNWTKRCYPLFAGIGGSYEYAPDNTAMEKWMIWCRFGISF